MSRDKDHEIENDWADDGYLVRVTHKRTGLKREVRDVAAEEVGSVRDDLVARFWGEFVSDLEFRIDLMSTNHGCVLRAVHVASGTTRIGNPRAIGEQDRLRLIDSILEELAIRRDA